MFFYEKRDEIDQDLFSVEEEVNYSYPLHLHRWYEMILVKDGELDVVLNEKTYTLRENDSIFIFPNQMHQLIAKKPSHHKLCLIKPELIAYFNSKIQNSVLSDPMKHIENDAWLAIYDSVSNSSSVEEMKGLLYLYCSFFNDNEYVKVQENDTSGNPDLMHRIFRFAADNFTKNCTLADLSANIGYDYSYLSKIFSEKIGMSFTEYVNTLRIERASYLLRNTGLSVLDISEQCGYGSLRSFNRNFMRKMGMTPRDYKHIPKTDNDDIVKKI